MPHPQLVLPPPRPPRLQAAEYASARHIVRLPAQAAVSGGDLSSVGSALHGRAFGSAGPAPPDPARQAQDEPASRLAALPAHAHDAIAAHENLVCGSLVVLGAQRSISCMRACCHDAALPALDALALLLPASARRAPLLVNGALPRNATADMAQIDAVTTNGIYVDV